MGRFRRYLLWNSTRRAIKIYYFIHESKWRTLFWQLTSSSDEFMLRSLAHTHTCTYIHMDTHARTGAHEGVISDAVHCNDNSIVLFECVDLMSLIEDTPKLSQIMRKIISIHHFTVVLEHLRLRSTMHRAISRSRVINIWQKIQFSDISCWNFYHLCLTVPSSVLLKMFYSHDNSITSDERVRFVKASCSTRRRLDKVRRINANKQVLAHMCLNLCTACNVSFSNEISLLTVVETNILFSPLHLVTKTPFF